jgi:hypothetical protein
VAPAYCQFINRKVSTLYLLFGTDGVSGGVRLSAKITLSLLGFMSGLLLVSSPFGDYSRSFVVLNLLHAFSWLYFSLGTFILVSISCI